jgi:integrase
MRERKARAHGPYRRGDKWRVVEVAATGARSTCSFDSEAEALDYIAEYNDEAEGRTLSMAIDEYIAHRTTGGIKAGSVTTLRFRLKAITRVVENDRMLSKLTRAAACDLYAARVAATKPDTHRAELASVLAMFKWCVEKGWLRINPFSEVKPVGRKARRHSHLRIDEARIFRDAALSYAHDGGLAALLPLLAGLRATEVTSLCVRDVDDGARVLWVTDAKTEAGNRKLDVPTELRVRLAKRIAGRAGDDRLFGDVDRRWLTYHVHRICELAKLGRKVSPHALRRTWSAIGAESMPVDAVSRTLGHASSTVTRRHYQPTNAEERRRGAAAQSVLGTTTVETGTETRAADGNPDPS